MYRNGFGVEKDIQKAVESFEIAKDQGELLASFHLGTAYEMGDTGIPKDPIKAAKYYEQAAQDGGIAAATVNLGVMYEHGNGVPQCYKLSLKCLTNASKFEDPLALYHLGNKYEHTKAFEFYERAARQKHGAAACRLGFLSSKGLGAELYQKSAAFGDAVGAFNCGLVFENGQGVPVNLFKARDYYTMAVRLKYDGEKLYLGPDSNLSRALYLAGEALQRDGKYKEGLDCYQAAVQQGYEASSLKISYLYGLAFFGMKLGVCSRGNALPYAPTNTQHNPFSNAK